MQAVIYDQFQSAPRVADVPEPEVPVDGVVIQVHATGLCRSDWHGWVGHDPGIRLPHVPGHELAGEVAAVGPQVERFRVGDRVTVPFCVGCGQCDYCRAGQQQICDRQFQPGFTAWGSFAEQVAIPHADGNLVRLPDELAFDEAATLGCRFVTAYRALIQQAKLDRDQHLVVFGCGGVGLSAVMIGAAAGATVTAVDIQEEALQLAERLGAANTLRWESPRQVGKQIATWTGGAHVVIDALGDADIVAASLRSLRKQGVHVQVGLLGGPLHGKSVPMNRVVAHELRIVGSHGMAAGGYPEILARLAKGHYPLQSLVTRRVGLDEAARLLPQMPQSTVAGVTVIRPTAH